MAGRAAWVSCTSEEGKVVSLGSAGAVRPSSASLSLAFYGCQTPRCLDSRGQIHCRGASPRSLHIHGSAGLSSGCKARPISPELQGDGGTVPQPPPRVSGLTSLCLPCVRGVLPATHTPRRQPGPLLTWPVNKSDGGAVRGEMPTEQRAAFCT